MANEEHVSFSEVLKKFESLGNNCEFGIVQRENDFDPPGLFRNVGFGYPDQMIHAIETSFENMFEYGWFDFGLPSHWADWRLDCRVHGMHFHTAIPRDTRVGSDEWERRSKSAIAVLRYLKNRMLEDLQRGDKIFVYRSVDEAPAQTIRQMSEAISAHGPGWLLYVTQGGTSTPNWVRREGSRLLVAKMERLVNEDPPLPDLAAWEAIMRAALEKQVTAELHRSAFFLSDAGNRETPEADPESREAGSDAHDQAVPETQVVDPEGPEAGRSEVAFGAFRRGSLGQLFGTRRRNDVQFWLESVSGKGFSRNLIPEVSAALRISGWMMCSGFSPIDETTTRHVLLKGKHNTIYVVSFHEFKKRPDVVRDFPEIETSNSLYCGFEAIFSLEWVPEGVYRVGFGISDADQGAVTWSELKVNVVKTQAPAHHMLPPLL
ncbi:MAG TPA: hypothetical protein VG651_22975 [Stellaceae bacterium]|nr:hypothetical protein [Stellaceae bacterium]